MTEEQVEKFKRVQAPYTHSQIEYEQVYDHAYIKAMTENGSKHYVAQAEARAAALPFKKQLRKDLLAYNAVVITFGPEYAHLLAHL